MKKLLSILLAVGVLLSCSKTGDGAGSSTDADTEVQSILVESVVSVITSAGEQVIPIRLEPAGLSIPQAIRAKCVSGEQYVSWSLCEEGLKVTPVGKGTVKFVFSALSGPASASLQINMVNNIASIELVQATSDRHWQGGKLYLTVGESRQLSVRLRDTEGTTVISPLHFESLSDAVSVDQDGRVTALKPGVAQAPVRISSALTSSIQMSVTIATFAKPERFRLSCGEGKRVNMKSGETAVLKVAVEPSNACQVLDFSYASGLKVSESILTGGSAINPYYRSYSFDGKGMDARVEPYTLTLKTLDGSVSETVNVAVVDYTADDVKVGDYVYRNSSTGAYRSGDCGLRINKPGGYENNEAKAPAPGSGERLAGIIIRLTKGSPTAYLGSSIKDENGNYLTDSNTYWFPGLTNHPDYHGVILSSRKFMTGSVWTTTNSYHSDGFNDNFGIYTTYQYTKSSISDYFTIASRFKATTGFNPWFIPGRSLLPSSSAMYCRKSFQKIDMDLVNTFPKDGYSYIWCAQDLNETYAYAFQVSVGDEYYKFTGTITLKKSETADGVAVALF